MSEIRGAAQSGREFGAHCDRGPPRLKARDPERPGSARRRGVRIWPRTGLSCGVRVGRFDTWQAVAVKRRGWAFVLLWPLTFAAIALLPDAHQSAASRVAVAVIVYAGAVAGLVGFIHARCSVSQV